MSVHLIQLEPGVGCELLQVLPGLVLDAAPAALVGVLLLRQRHSQDVGEDHFDVSTKVLDLTSIKIGKVPPAQLRICPFMCHVLIHLGYEVILEVTVGAGSVVGPPVDVHGAAAVLPAPSRAIYDHVHELGEAGLAVLLREHLVDPGVTVLDYFVLIGRHNSSQLRCRE